MKILHSKCIAGDIFKCVLDLHSYAINTSSLITLSLVGLVCCKKEQIKILESVPVIISSTPTIYISIPSNALPSYTGIRYSVVYYLILMYYESPLRVHKFKYEVCVESKKKKCDLLNSMLVLGEGWIYVGRELNKELKIRSNKIEETNKEKNALKDILVKSIIHYEDDSYNYEDFIEISEPQDNMESILVKSDTKKIVQIEFNKLVNGQNCHLRLNYLSNVVSTGLALLMEEKGSDGVSAERVVYEDKFDSTLCLMKRVNLKLIDLKAKSFESPWFACSFKLRVILDDFIVLIPVEVI
ncbi:hypothetical protein TCON_1345 [Astathelohania contejeani]|uniref:Uncharacterized protein n=1 Tax=Astathelohania contejeani TaxID=164912 RepID=A0ABQ7HZ26_9MICR|nr:hypothetical protein TCON_1345 [Thelohania contejeani]